MDSSPALNLPKVAFKPRRLGHVNLFVGDIEESTSFYTEVAGIELVRREPGIDAVFVSNGNTHHDIALMQCKGGAVRSGRGGYVQASSYRGEAPGLNHLAWEMESEAVLVERLRHGVDKGLKIQFSADHLISHSAYIADPEGNYHEFYADATEDWRAIFNPEREDLVTANWDWRTIKNPLGPMPVDPNDSRRVEDAMFHPRRITRAVLAAETPAVEAFISEVGGLKQVATKKGVSAYQAESTGYDLLIVPAATVPGPGLVGFSLQVEDLDDLQCSINAARDRGFEITVTDTPAKLSAVLRDPDGLAVEFYHPKGDDTLSDLPVPGDGVLWVFQG